MVESADACWSFETSLNNGKRSVLQASEDRKRAMFEAALDSIISMDHTGNIFEFNSAAERTFGYNRDEVLGRELATIIIPPDYGKATGKVWPAI